MKKYKTLLISLVALFGFTACASNPLSSYKATSDDILTKIKQGELTTAMKAESSSDILYNMEYGLVKRLNQEYAVSNYYFGLAWQINQAWNNSWLNTTGGQLSTSALSMLVNDSANSYQPTGYERTFLSTYHALNHLDLGDFSSARIEIKRMYETEEAISNYNQALYAKEASDAQAITKDKQKNYLAKQILREYNYSDINSPQVLALKNSYQNAFSHYLTGFVFEALHENSLARPGYLKAGQLNPYNKLIQQSINNLDRGKKVKKGYTDLLVIEETGHAPQLQSEEIHIPVVANIFGNTQCLNMINIFYPKLIIDNQNNQVYNYNIDEINYIPDYMTDVNLMAARSLHDQIPHIVARNVTAAIRNIVSSQAACSAGGNVGTLLSIATSLTGAVLDRADERSWVLLPSKIYINRISLPYGVHTIKLYLNNKLYTKQINLTTPYSVVSFRVMGNQVLF